MSKYTGNLNKMKTYPGLIIKNKMCDVLLQTSMEWNMVKIERKEE